MTVRSTRRHFSAAVFGGAGLAVLGVRPGIALGQPAAERSADDTGSWPGFPHQPADLVRDTVGASHANLERVRSLVDAHPALANATWDWGFGDWETALGAASHTGQREIAEYLISRGARPDLFTAAMLGQLETVRGLIAGCPGVQKTRGPHGISLLAHAEAGGERAAEVVAYLTELGDAGGRAGESPLSESDRDRYLGEYAYGPGPGERFIIKLQRGRVAFQKGDESVRFLVHLGDHRFHPVGAPGVLVAFAVEGGHCTRATVTDHDLRITGERV